MLLFFLTTTWLGPIVKAVIATSTILNGDIDDTLI